MKVGGKQGAANVMRKVERVMSREGMPPADQGSGDRRKLPQLNPGPKTGRKNEFDVFCACQEAAGSKDSAYFLAICSIAEA